MRRSRQGQSLGHNEDNTLPAILFFTAIAYKQNRIVAINETQRRILCLQVERARSKMLCAVDYIFNLLCAFNCLQPMKKFVFSVAFRATGRLQIEPSGSGDDNGHLLADDVTISTPIKLRKRSDLKDEKL